MARKFNLQPWRSQLREAQKKQFGIATGVVALVAAGLLYSYHMLQNGHIDDQQIAIQDLKKEIATFKKAEDEVKDIGALNDELLKQITVIHGLQMERGLTVKILNYLALNTPDSVFLQSLAYADGVITLEGVAENEMGVSAIIRNLERLPNVVGIRLLSMKRAEGDDRYEVGANTEVKTFTLAIRVVPDFQAGLIAGLNG